MAILTGAPAFTGRIGDITVYRLRGSDKLVMRQKGGASKQRIKKHPNYEHTRLNNSEWSGCVMAARAINTALYPMRLLADYNHTGHLTALCKAIQKDDGENDKGKRAVRLSQSQYKLEGFGYNKYHPFDTVLRHPLQYEVERNTGRAVIQMPEIIPGLNLRNPLNQPFCRFVLVLAVVADVEYSEERKSYKPVAEKQIATVALHTEWWPAKERQEPQELMLELSNWQPQEGLSLVLAVGVEFGQPVAGGEINLTKYSGAAKVLRVM